MHSRHDAKTTTKTAREKFLASFLAKVDPRHELPEAERPPRQGRQAGTLHPLGLSVQQGARRRLAAGGARVS
jgi:hypothetical protein